MKKLAVILLAFCCQVTFAQEDTYLLFEFMRVDNEQELGYAETENFWEKIHEQQAKNGDIAGWDLWQLQPGGEDQNFQYLTVHVFNDPVKMMQGGSWEDLLANAKAAYPDMSEEKIMKKIQHSSKTRDLAVRLYLKLVDGTDDEFDMPVGMVTRINFMKANPGQSGAYEKAEAEVFKPGHQRSVEAGTMGSWGLARVMVPYGSDVYASHLTFDMFANYKQMFTGGNDGSTLTEEQQKAMQDGLATRDLKWSSMGTLIKKVRASDSGMTEN